MESSLENVANLEKAIQVRQQTVVETNAELSTLAAQLCEARAVHAAEVKAAEEIRLAALKTELAETCAALDVQWTPQGERKVYTILAAFRQAKRSGQTSQTLSAFILRLKEPNGGRQVRRRWSDLVNWVQL